jgi:hypothetical protein
MPIVPRSPFVRSLESTMPELQNLERQINQPPVKDPERMREIAKRGFDWQLVLAGKAGPDTLEGAVSQEMQRATDQIAGDRHPAAGFQSYRFPFEALDPRFIRDTSDYVVGTSNVTGANLIETEVLGEDPVSALRPVSCLLGAGARVYESNKSNLNVPRIYQPPAASSGELQNVILVGNNGFTSQVLSLQAIFHSAGFPFSNQIPIQASNRKITQDFVKECRISLGKLVDNLAINGSGATNANGQKQQILGLNNFQSNSAGQYDPSKLVPSTQWAATPTVGNVMQAAYNLDAANFPESFEDRVWLLPPSMKQTLATTPAITGQSSQYLCDYRTGRVGPYKALVSNQLTATNNSFLLDAREACFLMVAGFELVVDRITYASSFQTLIVISILADFGMVRGGACLVAHS